MFISYVNDAYPPGKMKDDSLYGVLLNGHVFCAVVWRNWFASLENLDWVDLNYLFVTFANVQENPGPPDPILRCLV